MRFLTLVVAWCILLVLYWPLALLVLVLGPLVWLVGLAFSVAGICVAAVLALIRSVLFLPARLLGHRGA